MNKDTVFTRTAKGEELLDKGTADELPAEQRQVLALVNGRRSVATIDERLLAQNNVEQILESLLARQIITADAATAAPAPGPAAGPEQIDKARQFMINTLKTFAGSFRNAKLLQAISGATSAEELRSLIDPWYEAISDNPEGAVRIDELQAELLKLF